MHATPCTSHSVRCSSHAACVAQVQPKPGPDLAGAADAAASGGDDEERARGRQWQRLLHNLTAAPASARPTYTSHDWNRYATHGYGEPVPVGPRVRARARALLAQARFGLDPDFDGWAGYPAARERLLGALSGAAGGRAAVYAGDSHAAWAGRLERGGRDGGGARVPVPVALEFDGTSVSSSGPESWLPFVPPDLLSAGFVTPTPTPNPNPSPNRDPNPNPNPKPSPDLNPNLLSAGFVRS